MMEYYLMKQIAVSPVKPVLIDPEAYAYQLTEQAFMNYPDSSTGYYEYGEDAELPGVLTNPTYMVNTAIHRVVTMYDAQIEWKTFAVLPNQMSEMNRASETYWIPNLKRYDCLDDSAVVLPEGTIRKLVVNLEGIPNTDIFQIRGTRENMVAVSLALAESISRRGIYGVGFERIEVKQCEK